MEPSSDQLRLIACPRPFGVERVDIEVPAGCTVTELVETVVDPRLIEMAHAHVFVGDRYVPCAWHSRVRPRAGQTVTIRVAPRGGGDGKNPLATVLSIAVIAAAFVVPGLIFKTAVLETKILGSLTVGHAVTGAIPIEGALLVNQSSPSVAS